LDTGTTFRAFYGQTHTQQIPFIPKLLKTTPAIQGELKITFPHFSRRSANIVDRQNSYCYIATLGKHLPMRNVTIFSSKTLINILLLHYLIQQEQVSFIVEGLAAAANRKEGFSNCMNLM
jgi:hypothetical protein